MQIRPEEVVALVSSTSRCKDGGRLACSHVSNARILDGEEPTGCVRGDLYVDLSAVGVDLGPAGAVEESG